MSHQMKVCAAALASLASAWITASVLPTVQSAPLKVAAALLPAPFFILLLRALRDSLRQLDEMERGIHLETLATAFGGTIIFTFVYGYLQKAGLLELRPWDDVWLVAGPIYALAYVVTKRRYR